MKIHDISVTITPDLPTWPGDPSVVLERVNKMEEGANANVSRIDMGVHTGTHVDAPYHFIADGNPIETLDLEVLIGEVLVVCIPNEVKEITRETLEALELPGGIKRILFKTRNSNYWQEGEKAFQTQFVGIAESGAHFLVEKGIELVGIDYLSIAPFKKSRPTHQVLLKAKMVVIEGVDLSGIEAGTYELVCLPLKLGGSDGAPARVVLLER